MAGTLYVVATPIGNLGDLTTRAADLLRQVAVVAAEDTRETSKLLSHIGSKARLISLHAHSEAHRLDRVLETLAAGEDVAYCTDAGTPGISDPGPALVAKARACRFPVIPIPGPTAVATALSVTGWPADRYLFAGFLPRSGKDRAEWLARIRDADLPVVCFEAAPRLAGLLRDLVAVAGPDRGVMVGREMTKRFEEYPAGTLAGLAEQMQDKNVRGEVTLVVAGADPRQAGKPTGDAKVALALVDALKDAGMEPSRIAKVLVQVLGLSRNEGYRLAMEGR